MFEPRISAKYGHKIPQNAATVSGSVDAFVKNSDIVEINIFNIEKNFRRTAGIDFYCIMPEHSIEIIDWSTIYEH